MKDPRWTLAKERIGGVPIMKPGTTATRLVGFFEKYKERQITFKALTEHFNDIAVATLQYHLRTLIDRGQIVRVKQGIFRKNPDYQSPEAKRASVEAHIRTNGSPVQKGPPWKPGGDALTLTVSPVAISYLGQLLGESIVERMKTSGLFTSTDMNIVKRLFCEKYPLTEQQRINAER